MRRIKILPSPWGEGVGGEGKYLRDAVRVLPLTPFPAPQGAGK